MAHLESESRLSQVQASLNGEADSLPFGSSVEFAAGPLAMMSLEFLDVSEGDGQTWIRLLTRQAASGPISASWSQGRLRIVLPDLTTRSLLLKNVDWSDLEALDRVVEGRGIHAAFDRGQLELFMVGLEHEYLKYALGAMVDVLCEERDVPFEACESVTLLREDLQRRAEADKSFFFGDHAELMRGKSRLVLGIDPPPDLLIEIDVSHSSLDRMAIYAALGSPEVWRWHRDEVTFHQLQHEGTYAQMVEIAGFPGFKDQDAMNWIQSIHLMDKMRWRRSFREFVRAMPPHR